MSTYPALHDVPILNKSTEHLSCCQDTFPHLIFGHSFSPSLSLFSFSLSHSTYLSLALSLPLFLLFFPFHFNCSFLMCLISHFFFISFCLIYLCLFHSLSILYLFLFYLHMPIFLEAKQMVCFVFRQSIENVKYL